MIEELYLTKAVIDGSISSYPGTNEMITSMNIRFLLALGTLYLVTGPWLYEVKNVMRFHYYSIPLIIYHIPLQSLASII